MIDTNLKKQLNVLYNDGMWRIVNNEGEYTLMPFYANQNNGLPIKVPLDTDFENVFTTEYLNLIRRFGQ